MIPPSAESMLDDADALEQADPAAMLRQVASAGASVREAVGAATAAGIERFGEGGRPRAVVVTGLGTAALSGEILAALAGPRCPVPVVVHRDDGLPRWVGAADAVLCVSAAGDDPQARGVVGQAVSRGCSVLGVAPDGSPLAELVGAAHGVHVSLPPRRPARTALWSMAVPLVLAGHALDLLTIGPADLAATADRLDAVAEQCRPTSASFVNPAKQLAADLAGSLPMVWGASPAAGVAASRLAAQLAENAKYPSLTGVLPEAGFHQIAAWDGSFGGNGRKRDIFADPVDEPATVRLHLVVLRDSQESPRLGRLAETATELARTRGIGVTELMAEGDGPVERLASLVGLPDFASVYLALLGGTDPTPTGAVAELWAGAGA